MRYGHFDDDAREYVITRPDTPLPWLNYLGQDEFFGLCTNTAGGYTFWKDARFRRLTRYRYNGIPLDTGGRYLYVVDMSTGSVWNPGWKPVKAKLDCYECRHGLGYTRIAGEKDGIEVVQTMFIPRGENLELWKIDIANTSAARKSVKIYSFQEFAFYEALNDMTNFQRTLSIGEVEVEGSAIYHKTEYRERRNHYTLFACTRAITGFDTDRDVFAGVHEGLHEARVPFAGRAGNSMACGWNPIGSHEVTIDLAPGETADYAYILAYVDRNNAGSDNAGSDGSPADLPGKFIAPGVMDKTQGRAIVDRYSTPGATDAAFVALKEYWNRNLAAFFADCPDPRLSRMVSVWNQYQCMATFNLSRAASMYETGIGRGMGFRDSNQDILGIVHMIPARARARILDIAATQLMDGTCYHQYQPLTKKGNAEVGGDFYDDHLWLILSTCAYIKETGDFSILDEPCGYADATYSGDSENATGSDVNGNSAGSDLSCGLEPRRREPLIHHLETSIAYTMKKRGPHGLPLIGHADWNDCLNLNCFSTEPDESFQTAGDVSGSKAESVMIAGLFLYAARELAGLYTFMDRPDDAARISRQRDDMLETVERTAWDGSWYLRAFDAAGRPIGSASNDEGQIFIESQGWCVLGGAGAQPATVADSIPGAASDPAQGNSRVCRARRALQSVHERLFTPDGAILQQPAYSTYRPELGEISSYPPGVKENAGIFSHNNTWIHLAWCLLGEGERALEYYISICPSAKEDKIDTYRAEPYVYAQMTAGRDSPRAGEAKNSWLTGTATWSFVSASQGILGIKPDYDSLVVDPCIPKSWPGFTVTRIFRGATYSIEVKNPVGVCAGVASLTVDGQPDARAVAPIHRADEADGAAGAMGAAGRNIARLPIFPAGTAHRIEVMLG